MHNSTIRCAAFLSIHLLLVRVGRGVGSVCWNQSWSTMGAQHRDLFLGRGKQVIALKSFCHAHIVHTYWYSRVSVPVGWKVSTPGHVRAGITGLICRALELALCTLRRQQLRR